MSHFHFSLFIFSPWSVPSLSRCLTMNFPAKILALHCVNRQRQAGGWSPPNSAALVSAPTRHRQEMWASQRECHDGALQQLRRESSCDSPGVLHEQVASRCPASVSHIYMLSSDDKVLPWQFSFLPSGSSLPSLLPYFPDMFPAPICNTCWRYNHA